MNTAQFNTARVLREIRKYPGILRIDIAQKLSLDKSTISLIVSGLVEKGLIQYSEEERSGPKGGRKKMLLELNKKYGYILGLEIQSDYYKLSVLNLQAEIMIKESGNVHFDHSNLLWQIEQIIAAFKAKNPSLVIIGISIGFTGIVNPDEGTIHYSIPLKIRTPFSLVKKLERRLGISVHIENDANCGAWTELNVSAKTIAENFIFVLMKFWDTDHQEHFAKIGLGLGIVINGKVYHGSDYSAGEFKSIFGKGSTKSQFGISDEEIEQIPENPECTKKLISELASNMALMVNTFNLEKIVIGCDVSFQQEFILKTMSEEIKNNWHYPFDSGYEVKFSGESEHLVSKGAAMMFLEKIFELSLTNEKQGIQYLNL